MAIYLCISMMADAGIMSTLRLTIIQSDPLTTSVTMRTPKASASGSPFASSAMRMRPLVGIGEARFGRTWVFPTAAQRADQVDAGAQLQGIEIERLQLGLQDGGLRGDDGEIGGRTLDVERHGKVQRTLRGVDRSLLVQSGVVVVIECGEAVFDLLKRADDGAGVIRGGGVELGARLGDLRPAQAAVEHAEQGVRSDRPERTRCAQPVREGLALEAGLSAE